MRHSRLGSLALASLALTAAATPASAATCTRWQMRGTTFFINQSDGFLVQVTPGRLLSEGEDYIRFSTSGSLSYERKTGIFNQNNDRSGGHFQTGVVFHKIHPGYISFTVNWNSGLTGQYYGNIYNPRYHEGALIADLKGWVTGGRSAARATWATRQPPIYCRKADEVPDVDPRAVPSIALTLPAPPPVACKQGEVWRERHNGDVVCVHPDQRWVMEDGSCRAGYVKLGVGPKKDTCGTPKMKAKAEADAAKAEAAAAKDKMQSGNPQDFAGTWSTTKKGETIILTLQINGNEVTGDFASTSNPENKGTLTGTVKTYDGNFGPIVKLSYTSTQPVEANGSFDVFTDGKLEGGYTWREPGKAKKTFVRWNGIRASN